MLRNFQANARRRIEYGVLLGRCGQDFFPRFPVRISWRRASRRFSKILPPSESGEKPNLGFRSGFEKGSAVSASMTSQLVETFASSCAFPQMGYLNAPIGGWIVNPRKLRLERQ
jgi:hypothetical protein